MSQIPLPVVKRGIEIQIKRFREQDGQYVRHPQVLFTVELPAFQQSARNDWAAVYHVVTTQMMGYTVSSRDVLTRIEKEHLLGGGCRQLKGLHGGHWMVLFDLGDLPLQTRNILAPELSIGLLDLILQVAEQIAIVAGLDFSPGTRLNQLTCTFGHFRYDERANVYSILLCHKWVRMQYASSIRICDIACLRCLCTMPIYMILHDTCLHSGGGADSLDRLAAFGTKHGLTAQIAALSEKAKLAAFSDVLRASKKLQAMEEAGERVESLEHLKDLGDECSLDRLAAFATKHGLTAQIAALSKEAKLAAFSDVLRASKKLQAMEEAGERVESLQHLKDLGAACSRLLASSRLAAFATTHDLTAPLAALSEKAKRTAFAQLLAASKPLKELEARGERVRDLQHLKDIARPALSAAGQAGSRRQVNERGAEWLWEEYKRHVGEGPVALRGHDPFLVSLPQLRAHASDGDFDEHVLKMLTRSDWDATRFVHTNGVDRIREIICDQTNLQYGDHIATSAHNFMTRRRERIRQIQPTWEPSRPKNYCELSNSQRKIETKRAISQKYVSLKREVQGSVVNTFPVEDRAKLAVALALSWYHHDSGI